MEPNLDNALVVAFTWPTGQMKPEMVRWLIRCGVPVEEEHWKAVCRSPYAAAIEEGIWQALASPFDYFLFVENAVFVRGDEGDAFWDVEADAACMEGGCARWDAPNEFHEGLWRTTRRALAALNRPVVRENMGICPGRQLRLAMELAGFSVRHGGLLLHERMDVFPSRPRDAAATGAEKPSQESKDGGQQSGSHGNLLA